MELSYFGAVWNFYFKLPLTFRIWQVADYGLQTCQITLLFERGRMLEYPQNQLFAILHVMGFRSFQNIALGGLYKTHNLL